MKTVQDRIIELNNLGYFNDMQTVSTDEGVVIYVAVMFPPRWIVSEEVVKKYNVTVNNGEERGKFYFASTIDVGFDNIFDAIDESVKKMKEAEEKSELYEEKKKELYELFSDEANSIEALRTLEFTFSNFRKRRSKPTETKTEEVTDNNEEMAQEEKE